MLLWLVSGKQPLRRRKGASGRQSASVGASSSPRSRFASCPVWHTWSLVGERLVHIAKGPYAAAGQRGQFPGSARVDISTAVLCAGARDLRRASGRKRVLPWIPPKSTDSLSAKLSANQRTLWQTSATLHTLRTPHSSPFPSSGSALTRKRSLVQIQYRPPAVSLASKESVEGRAPPCDQITTRRYCRPLRQSAGRGPA
jgi:hypothetical protein